MVDDHPIVRQGLAQLINDEEDLAVCGEASNAHEALSLLQESHPDLVVVDISLEGTDGLALIKQIQASDLNPSILVLSVYGESVYAERALKAGAQGYVMKQQATEHVLTAIRSVLGGDIFLSHDMQQRLLQKAVRGSGHPMSDLPASLSNRELEVFRLIGSGFSTRRIAEHLRLSVKTIEAHRAHIKRKLGLEDVAQLMQYASLWVEKSKGELTALPPGTPD